MLTINRGTSIQTSPSAAAAQRIQSMATVAGTGPS